MPWKKDGTRKKPGAYKMKYTKGGFPFKIDPPVDLTKKSGFGPIEIHKDDQSKRAAKSKYEMGEYKIDPTETDAEVERREDAEGR